MLNSGKKIRASCDKKKFCLRRKFSERNKKTYPPPPPPPPCKLNGRSLSIGEF